MVVTAPRTAGPAAVPARSRFSALIVSMNSSRRGALAHRMRQYGARRVAEASTHAEARLRGRLDGSHDLCIIDGTVAEAPILPLAQELRGMGWRRIVILTNREDGYAVRAALGSGIRGYVVAKRSDFPKVSRGLIPMQRSRSNYGPDELSSREVEVIQAVAEGRSNKEIGDELGLSALTVKSHLARIARKLGTGDRAEMVAITMRSGSVR